MLGTKEHYDVIDMFDREYKGHRLDKEDRSLWRRGIVYQDSHVNELFGAYLRGYAFAKALATISTAPEAQGGGE